MLPVYFLPYDYRQDKADKKFSCTGTNRSAKGTSWVPICLCFKIWRAPNPSAACFRVIVERKSLKCKVQYLLNVLLNGLKKSPLTPGKSKIQKRQKRGHLFLFLSFASDPSTLSSNQILSPWPGWYSWPNRPATLHRLAGWYDNPMPESTTEYPQGQSGTKNLASAKQSWNFLTIYVG